MTHRDNGTSSGGTFYRLSTGTSNWIFGKSLVSLAEIENHMDHYDDGNWRCHISPAVLKV